MKTKWQKWLKSGSFFANCHWLTVQYYLQKRHQVAKVAVFFTYREYVIKKKGVSH
jgi:hypothetical protein